MSVVFIALGSNIGDRSVNIQQAIDQMKERGIHVMQASTLIETEPVGGPAGQNRFLNGVLKVQTELDPHTLLDHLQAIEQKLGRERTVANGPRTIDLDILLFDQIKLHTDRLTIPHPRMWERPFVMQPLLEIAPEWGAGGKNARYQND